MLALYDELWSGVAVVAAPEVERLHEVDHAGYALWVFAVPLLAGALIEAPLSLLVDRLSRRRILAAGLGALALALACCAAATTTWLLAAGLAMAGAASGVACSAAQSELVSTYPGGPHRAMSRWIAFGALGDAITPLAIAFTLWLGGTHRATLAALAVLLGVQALMLARPSRTEAEAASAEGGAATGADDEASDPLLEAVRAAVRVPRLWLFLAAASACALLDEVVVALAALRLQHDRGMSATAVAAAMTGLSTGAVLGALLSERLLARWTPRGLMLASALGSMLTLAVFILSASTPVAASALFLLGVCASSHYPLVKASAYAAFPGRPGTVNALAQVFVVVEILLPLLVGWIAERWGLAVGLSALALEPLTILAVALLRDPAGPPQRSKGDSRQDSETC